MAAAPGKRVRAGHPSVHAAALALLLALAVSAPVRAAERHLQDYMHTSWTAKDGAPANITMMAQTRDGWIWMASLTELYRFDGVRFERFTLPGQDQPGRGRIYTLYASADGNLWVQYTNSTGVSVLRPDGTLVDVLMRDLGDFAEMYNMAQSADGTMWAATGVGLFSLGTGGFHRLGAAEGLPGAGECFNVLEDGQGQVWLQHEQGVYLRRAGSARFEKISNAGSTASLLLSPDGRAWRLARDGTRIDLLSAPVAGAGPVAPARPNFNQAESRLSGLFDRDGNLWDIQCPNGICLVAGAGQRADRLLWLQPAAINKFDAPPKLSGDKLNAVLEDSDGSIWIATSGGVDRFRASALVPARVPGGPFFSMAVDDAGQAWIVDGGADNSVAWRTGAGVPPVADRSQPYQLITKDRHGGILLAGRREIERRYGGRVEKITLPPASDGRITDLSVLGLQDDGRVIWMYSVQTGLVGYLDGAWHPHSDFNFTKVIILSTPGGGGRFWLACSDRSIQLYDNNKITDYPAAMIGFATVLYSGEHMVIAGDKGMAVLKGKAFRSLHAADPRVLLNVSGIVATADGDFWLNGDLGVVHVARADWRASMANPDLPLRYRLLGVADGYTGHALIDNRQPSAMVDGHGDLWFATTEGVLRLDANAAVHPARVPLPSITGFTAADVRYPAQSGRRLPAALQSLSIDYAAPGLAKPENTRFQYRLAGEESGWQDAGLRRTAYYTSIGPGAHRFEVRAMNAEGVWSVQPAVLEFQVAPTLVQTLLFRLLLVAFAAGVLALLYRWRIHRLAAQFRARMDERLDERNRIARELHDTLLQSVQGLLLKVHGVAVRMPEQEPLRGMLDAALVQAEGTIAEGRSRVRELRGADDSDGLLVLLKAACGELGAEHGVRCEVASVGVERRLKTGVSVELFAICREAMINACRHAGASVVSVEVAYEAKRLRLVVADDGIGIAADVLAAGGRIGHWGIAGMRERAAALGAKLEVQSAPGAGTRCVLVMTAPQAYEKGARRWFALRKAPRP